jgi:colanic acid biosynthesis glycosyl transferase WcaI
LRILVLGINYWPEEFGIAPFNTGRCEYLASIGHEVTVCTGFPYYPEWRIPDGYRGRLITREERNGVRILRSYLYVPGRVTSTRRILHEGSFVATSLVRALKRRKPDMLFVVSPPLGLAISAIMLNRIWRIPFVFHVPDLQPDAARDLGMLKEGKVINFLYSIERLAYRNADLVSTLTPAMRERILSKGVVPEKVVLFQDWVDPSLFDIPLQGGGEAFRNSFGLRNQFLVVHAGNMGVKQGLDVVLGAAHRSSGADHISYLLVGDGAARPALTERASAINLPNLRFLSAQPKEVFTDMLAATDICLITQQQVVADIVFPSKTMTILAAGRPIVASLSAGSEVARVIKEAHAGEVVKPEDPQALFETVTALSHNREARAAMGESGRNYARTHWDRNRALSYLEAKLLDQIRIPGAFRYPNRPMSLFRRQTSRHDRI